MVNIGWFGKASHPWSLKYRARCGLFYSMGRRQCKDDREFECRSFDLHRLRGPRFVCYDEAKKGIFDHEDRAESNSFGKYLWYLFSTRVSISLTIL